MSREKPRDFWIHRFEVSALKAEPFENGLHVRTVDPAHDRAVEELVKAARETLEWAHLMVDEKVLDRDLTAEFNELAESLKFFQGDAG